MARYLPLDEPRQRLADRNGVTKQLESGGEALRLVGFLVDVVGVAIDQGQALRLSRQLVCILDVFEHFGTLEERYSYDQICVAPPSVG